MPIISINPAAFSKSISNSTTALPINGKSALIANADSSTVSLSNGTLEKQ
jgi:hypothetical protein